MLKRSELTEGSRFGASTAREPAQFSEMLNVDSYIPFPAGDIHQHA